MVIFLAMYNLYYANLSSQLWQTGSTDHILVTICFLRLCILIKIGKMAGVCHIRQAMNLLVWYANSMWVLGITKCETSRHIFSRRHGHRYIILCMTDVRLLLKVHIKRQIRSNYLVMHECTTQYKLPRWPSRESDSAKQHGSHEGDSSLLLHWFHCSIWPNK